MKDYPCGMFLFACPGMTMAGQVWSAVRLTSTARARNLKESLVPRKRSPNGVSLARAGGDSTGTVAVLCPRARDIHGTFRDGTAETPRSRGTSPKHYGHFKPTAQRYPAFSAGVVPFLWMMRRNLKEFAERLELDVDPTREPDLGYETNWGPRSAEPDRAPRWFRRAPPTEHISLPFLRKARPVRPRAPVASSSVWGVSRRSEN